MGVRIVSGGPAGPGQLRFAVSAGNVAMPAAAVRPGTSIGPGRAVWPWSAVVLTG